ncbi:hypothetical protein Q8F55_000075 [Vanrija albida]|uniref:F-box domain-containing protein n=1 Tax=Vanrija albida TaxID=181172 RepID=A0ABR3QC73_9TREE
MTDPTTTTIDHRTHPHIIDAIISYAPISAVAQLRATSRALRDRVDHLLFHHVALFPRDWSDPPPSYRGEEDRASQDLAFTTAGLDSYHDGGITIEAYPRVPSALKILDVVHIPLRPHTFDLSQLTSVHTLRRMKSAATAVAERRHTRGVNHFGTEEIGMETVAHTLVDFIDVTPYDDDMCLPLQIELPDPHCQLERYVLHLRWDETNPSGDPSGGLSRSFLLWGPPDHSGTECVLVLHPTPAEEGTEVARSQCEGLLEFIDGGWTDYQFGTMTIVGLERVSPRQLPSPIGIEASEQVRNFRIYHPPVRRSAAGATGDASERPRETTEAMRFVTYEARLDELGDRWQVEGVWPACADNSGSDLEVRLGARLH